MRTKIIVYLISGVIFAGAGAFLWRDLRTHGIWALLPLVGAILFGWGVYKQAVTAKNR
jgi:hypothetical protein